MFEIPVGKGRLWVCDLDFEQTLEVDPLARKFAENLCRAAADKESTSHLPKLLSHEELLSSHVPWQNEFIAVLRLNNV